MRSTPLAASPALSETAAVACCCSYAAAATVDAASSMERMWPTIVRTASMAAPVSDLVDTTIVEMVAVADAVWRATTASQLAPLLTVPEARAVAYDVADSQIVSQKLGAEAFLAALRSQRVTLNPRYGVLDPAQKTIVSGQSGSLSVPAQGETPAP